MDLEAGTGAAEQASAREVLLNRLQDLVVFKGGHRPIDKDDYKALKSINQRLRALRRPERDKVARTQVDAFYRAIKQPRLRTLAEVGGEAATLQVASALNAAIGLSPTLLNHFAGLSRTQGGAAGFFVGQMALSVVQPFMNVYIFNAIYSAFDTARSVGQPGRSGQLEGVRAPRLVDAFEGLKAAVADLEATLRAARAGQRADGTPLPAGEALAEVGSRNRATKDKLENRYAAEAFSDSYETSRVGQSVLSAVRQLLYLMSGVTRFTNNDHCQAGDLSFKILAYSAAATQALQALVAIGEKFGESDRLVKKNLAYTELRSKADIRGTGAAGLGGMVRSPYTQVGWAVDDTINKPISQRYAELSREFNLSETEIRKFDEGGGFNHPKFSQTGGGLPAQRQAALEDFLSRSEGPPIEGCRGAFQELEKLVVLEDIGKLHLLEDLDRMGALRSAERSHGPLDPASKAELAALRDRFDLAADGSSRDQLEPIRVRFGLDSREHAAELMKGKGGPAHQTPDLARAISEARAAFDPVAQERHDDVLARVRILLKLDSADDAADLLEAPGLPRSLGDELTPLRAKYDADGPFFLLRSTLGLGSLDEAKALRRGLPPEMDRLLGQLHDKYEIRKSLPPGQVLTIPREQMLELIDSVKATNLPEQAMPSVRGMVVGKLIGKFFTSSLNAAKWQRPTHSGRPDEDQARRDKSLTPFEHTLLQMALAQPKAVMDLGARPPRPVMETVQNADGSAVTRPLANTAKLNADMPEPRSMVEVRRILARLMEHKADNVYKNWDYTRLSAGPADRILAVIGPHEGVVDKATNFAGTVARINWDRRDMPGYLTPAFTAQVVRQTLMVAGGTLFYFLLSSGLNLARKGLGDNGTFECNPQTGGPNEATRGFDKATFAIQAAFALPAIYAALNSGAFSIMTSNLRGKEYFLRTEGRPSFFQMLREHYAYGANLKGLPWKAGAGVATDHGRQAWPGGEGRAMRARAEALTAEADAWLDEMTRTHGQGETPAGVELADLSHRAS